MDFIDLRKHEHLSYDYSRNEKPDRPGFYMHMHDQMEVYYLVEGNIEYHIENHLYFPKAGDIMIMRPGELHTSQVEVEHGGAYERFNIRFSPELLKESLNSRLLLPFLNRPAGVFNLYSSKEIPSDYIHSCFRRMFTQQSDNNGVRTISYLIPVLQEIYDVWITREKSEQKSHTSLPSAIISYINQHLSTLRSPQELSEVFYLSQSQIHRVFHEYTGTSVWSYVRTKRLITARELMQNGETPAKAAIACGFADYSTFYRAYKRQFGCSPQKDCQD